MYQPAGQRSRRVRLRSRFRGLWIIKQEIRKEQFISSKLWKNSADLCFFTDTIHTVKEELNTMLIKQIFCVLNCRNDQFY